MFQVTDKIFIGNREDLEWLLENNETSSKEEDKYSLCLCAKTYHKMAAKFDNSDEVGYKGNMPKDQKEYLIAERPNSRMLAVNLIDAPNVNYIPKVIIDKCLEFIDNEINQGRKIAVLCDKGESRSACIVLMWFIKTGCFKELNYFEEVEEKFRNNSYSNYFPNMGMREYTKQYFYEMRNK